MIKFNVQGLVMTHIGKKLINVGTKFAVFSYYSLSTLMNLGNRFPRTSVNLYQTAWRHTTKDGTLHLHSCEDVTFESYR
jgi:hypothetical protein